MAEHETAGRLPASSKLTYEDYMELPDDGLRYEILDGELAMTPSPRTRHQIVSLKLAMRLGSHVESHGLGTIMTAPVDVILDASTVVVPDIVFVLSARSAIVTERAVEGAPDLVVDIPSPTTKHRDRDAKTKLYARFGVAHYWIVDTEERTVEIRQLDGDGYVLVRTCKGHETVVPALFPGLSLDLGTIWS